MKRLLWVVSVLLVAAAIYVLFGLIPGRASEVARRGVKTDATVQFKDSQPTGDGRTLYVVKFVYQDDQKKNHLITNKLTDAGEWNDLKPGSDIKIYYLPDNPDKAYMPGAVGMAAPNASALKFVAWSAIFAAIACAVYALRLPKPAPRVKGPVMTRR